MRSLRTAAACTLAGAVAVVAAGTAGAANIAPYQAHQIVPYHSHAATRTNGGKAAGAAAKAAPLASFFHVYRTWVPGAAYTTAGDDPNHDKSVVSAGAAGEPLTIRAGGTYTWHGKTGRWARTGDAEYPIVLRRALDGHDWKVGVAPSSHKGADIVVWDGFAWEDGKRLR